MQWSLLKIQAGENVVVNRYGIVVGHRHICNFTIIVVVTVDGGSGSVYVRARILSARFAIHVIETCAG